MSDESQTHDLEFDDSRPVPYEELGKVLWMGELARLSFAQNDVGVLMFKERLPMSAYALIKDYWTKVMGERKLLILDSGTTIGVLALRDDSNA